MSVVTRVGKRYTIVIPKEIRSKVKLKEGDHVIMYVVGQNIIIEPLPDDPFRVLEDIIPEKYAEEEAEKKAYEWLMRNASS